MMATVYCGRHAKVVQIEPPAWGPPVLRWPAIRALLTGCPCADPDPGTFDDLWREIRLLLEDVDDEIAEEVEAVQVRPRRQRRSRARASCSRRS